jgi:hypothetical protein
MDKLNAWEIIVALATFANVWLNVNVKNSVLALKLEITEKFVSKEDFKSLREHEK